MRFFGKTEMTRKDVNKWAAKRNVKKLLKAIDNDKFFVSQDAVEALAKIGDPATAEPLLQHIVAGKFHCIMTSRVLVAIGGFSGPKLIPLFIELLSVKSYGIDQGAATALRNFGEVTVEPLIVALKSSDLNSRQWAAQLLGLQHDPRAVEPLIANLDDADLNMRIITKDALAMIGGSRAAEALQKETLKNP